MQPAISGFSLIASSSRVACTLTRSSNALIRALSRRRVLTDGAKTMRRSSEYSGWCTMARHSARPPYCVCAVWLTRLTVALLVMSLAV